MSSTTQLTQPVSSALTPAVSDHEPAILRAVLLSLAHAHTIATWRYDEPLSHYNLGRDALALLAPANNAIAIIDARDELVAYRTFGVDGKVPGFAYDDTALDTGGGLAPCLVGSGRGAAVIELGLTSGASLFNPLRWRVTVAADNGRALKVVSRLGFLSTATFVSPNNKAFVVLERDAAHHHRSRRGTPH